MREAAVGCFQTCVFVTVYLLLASLKDFIHAVYKQDGKCDAVLGKTLF